MIKAYLGEPEEEELPPEVAADLGRRGIALMLRLEDVHTFYGNIEALKGVSVDVEQGQIVTIIGSNGAGKSTLLMTICGSPKARQGPGRLRRPGHHPARHLRHRQSAASASRPKAAGSSRA